MDKYRNLESVIRDLVSGVPMLENTDYRYSRICNTIKNMYEQAPKKVERDQNDQIAVGSYMTKHFEMNPKAQLLYTDLPKDTNPAAAENSAIAHDRLFSMEKQILSKGQSTPEEVKNAEHLVDLIKLFAKQMNLEKEHEYINKNLDRIKSMSKNYPDDVSNTPMADILKTRFKVPPAKQQPEPKDTDIDSSKFLITRNLEGQRKLKIIDAD